MDSSLKAALPHRLAEYCLQQLLVQTRPDFFDNKEAEDCDVRVKRMKMSVESSLEEYLCPISMELPFVPVTAMDSKIHERADIEKWIYTSTGEREGLKSPVTNLEMKKTLIPAPRIFNSIQKVVENNEIDSTLAKSWLQRKNELDTYNKELADMLPKADAGNAEAMSLLGALYLHGCHGHSTDQEQAQAWLRRAYILGHPNAMATLEVLERKKVLVERAATSGSDVACYTLGRWYENGLRDVPRDIQLSKYYFENAVSVSCKYKQLQDSCIKKWLADNE